MAKLKTAKNMLQNRDEYARHFTNFRGVDFSSDHTEVLDQRFAYLVNMWRDYRSGEGGAIETIPGYRRVYETPSVNNYDTIYGVHEYGGYRLVHGGEKLINIDVTPTVICELYTHPETGVTYVNINDPEVKKEFITKIEVDAKVFEEFKFETLEEGEYIPLENYTPSVSVRYARVLQGVKSPKMAKHKSNSIFFNKRLYIFDGENIYWWEGNAEIHNLVDEPHIPTTHRYIYPGSTNSELAPGFEFNQRNILTPKYKNCFIAGTHGDEETMIKEGYEPNVFKLKYGSDIEDDFSTAAVEGRMFPKDDRVEVYQYGVKLPFMQEDENGISVIPPGYPNAIKFINKSGEIRLAKAPPRPEENTWNPEKGAFDFTEEEIKGGIPKIQNYQWPFAFASTHDGIEIIAENAITNINGIEARGEFCSIITKCTIATVFDNRLFLSGNPEFPTHIFWSGLNGETSYPDPSFFGIANNDIEGVTDSPVVAMVPVADQLMVLKKENASEGSVIFHTPTIGEDNVMPKKYPSTQGLAGRGCLGAACNFLDDPVFVSRYGLEAMGSYTNAKYERSIEHRSSLVDAKLLSCDLSKAELIEYEGYLLLLVEGKIFMADSRQTFTHATGVMQYEWYYLEDIGVWEGQKEEYLYAMLPGENPNELLLTEATAWRDEFGIERNLIGSTVEGEIYYDESGGYHYTKLRYYDENGKENLLTGNVRRYYVEASGAMTGGSFVPAERLYVIGSDLYFSAGKHLCKFYFDKRDKESGIIPIEYYNFDERRIFSGCATKMDNCGIPHLTKNTVKRSTVIKTRTYTHSNAKIKVRTNRQSFKQVGRIISGHEVFEGLDFADFTFSPEGNTLFSINEKEKKWVEKQHFIYSDEYCRPFALYYLVYRYNVAGRYKDH